MRRTLILLAVALSCCLNLSAADSTTQQKGYYDWGWAFRGGYSMFLPAGDLQDCLDPLSGFQLSMDVLYRRAEFSASINLNKAKAKNDFMLNDEAIAENDNVEIFMGGFSFLYSPVYTDGLRISPLAGAIWTATDKKMDDVRTHGKLNGTVGLQIECTAKGLTSGDLTSGTSLPLYLRYNYCFPQKYDALTGGMHFVTIGLGFCMKNEDKVKN